MSTHSGRFHIAMIVVVLAAIAGPGGAATADPASPVKIEKTPAQKEHEAHAAALQAIHDAVEASIAHHPEISAELKAQLRQPSLHETWVKSVNEAAKKALESTPLLKGVEVTDAMKADFQANALKNLTEGTVEEIIRRSLEKTQAVGKPLPPGNGPHGKLAGMPKSMSASETYIHSSTTNLTTGKSEVEDRHSYMVNGRDVSKEEHDRVKAQIQGLADDMANQMGPQRR